MDRALNPMTSGHLRDRKGEDTERHRQEGDKKTEERLEGCSHKPRTPRLARSPQKPGEKPGRASHSDEIGCVQGGMVVDSFSLRAARKGRLCPHLDLRLLAARL